MAMPNDESDSAGDTRRRYVPLTPAANAPTAKTSIFDVPAPLKRVFDKFPLREYAANELPVRAPRGRDEHRLHVFSGDEAAKQGRPSYNPGCLKWQTYLRFTGLEFRIVPSSNHASPSGILPFLLPAASASGPDPDPIPANKFRKWLATEKGVQKLSETTDIRYEAYTSLVEGRIRKLWLYQLYLAPQNDALVEKLYTKSCSSVPLVQMAIKRQLRAAAEVELVKSAGASIVDVSDLVKDAEEAFEALSTLLGEDQWFFAQETPGLFDASLFAYTYLVLDSSLNWQFNKLADMLLRHQNVVEHKQRISKLYF